MSRTSKKLRFITRIDKRFRAAIAVGLCVVMMVVYTVFAARIGFYLLPFMLLCTYVATWFAIFEGIRRWEWLMLFVMPLLWTLAWCLLLFFVPIRWLTRVPFVLLYGVGIYAVILSSNIFNVGVEKSLQLYRPAFAISVLLHAVIIFLFSLILFTFQFSWYTNALIATPILVVMVIHAYWSVSSQEYIDRSIWRHVLITVVVLVEYIVILSFVHGAPRQTILALAFTGGYYGLVGIIQLKLQDSLFYLTAREYILVFAFTLLILLLTARMV